MPLFVFVSNEPGVQVHLAIAAIARCKLPGSEASGLAAARHRERRSMPGRKKDTRIFSAALMFAAGILAMLAAREYLPYWTNQFHTLALRKELDTGQEEGQGDIEDSKDWDKLHKINEDIIAWIEVPGTKVDYPVLRCPSSGYYLHRDFRKRKNVLGSIFVQPETPKELSGHHTVIYGHNMRDKQMFGSLHYFESGEFFRGHREVFIYLPGETIRAVPYSVYDCQDATDTYQTEFRSEEEWRKWQEMTVEKSYHDAAEKPDSESQVLTLSTCSNGRGRKSRFVVNCIVRERRVLDAESVNLYGKACCRPGT